MISPSEKCGFFVVLFFVFYFVFTLAVLSVSRIWGNGHFPLPIVCGNINFSRDYGGQFDNVYSNSKCACLCLCNSSFRSLPHESNWISTQIVCAGMLILLQFLIFKGNNTFQHYWVPTSARHYSRYGATIINQIQLVPAFMQFMVQERRQPIKHSLALALQC